MSTADYDSARKALGENENVVVKCKYGDEIRRIPIMQIPTYDELCFILQRLFKKGLSSNVDNYILRYKDDEGDWISLSDDVDIQHAISQSPVLRVTVYDKSVPTLRSMNNTTLTELKAALKKLQSDLDGLIASLPDKMDKDVAEPKRQSTSQPLSTADMQELLGAKKEQSAIPTTEITPIAPIAPPPQSSNPVTASPAPIAPGPYVASPKLNNAQAPQRRTSTSSVYSTTSTQTQPSNQPARQSQHYNQQQYSQQQQQSNAYPSQYPSSTQPHQYPASLQPSGGQSPGLQSQAQSQSQPQPQQYPQQNQHYQGAYQNQQQGQAQTAPQPYSQTNSNYYQRQSYAGPSQTPSQAPVQMPYAPQQRPPYGLPPVQGQPSQPYRY